MTRVVLSLTLALAALLLAIAPASAQTCNAPPGTAAVDQYCENVPSAGGDGGGGGGSQGGSPAQALAEHRPAIRRAGQSGKELNTLPGRQTSPPPAPIASEQLEAAHLGSQEAQQDQPADASPRQPSSNPLGAVQSAVNSGSTIGDGFIWILIAIALLIAGTAWLRHRRRSGLLASRRGRLA